jgi:hypothetical protein
MWCLPLHYRFLSMSVKKDRIGNKSATNVAFTLYLRLNSSAKALSKSLIP